ncbi:thiamine pyrophosphate-binding protein [Paenactinomyces guangxiensis]|uniref:Thiamine pyrophosphate-binding protein n=1 Tax=Paenactinomyces guangxiensis TaxID=1490290 RepID=A0A7W1WRP7_9BACL|nr:thiamine pyrophosphate-binding protein [Paenactinomyces guangxiensis]MBA4494832.1 thiamine pyrophosphate-binding protein [Paenactinomyces guangxiensis]MBH8591915.1 thiamine pyrophosphate-binding protein [Paenactinomyces guangxiensis]
MEFDFTDTSRTVARHLIEQLAEWGCQRIYGVIGDANLYLLDELAKQDRIEYIACRHETSAALMASAEAKLTGKLAVCTATSGPGIALLLNGLADASHDRAPVLAVTGQVERSKLGTGSKQEIDQQKLIEPIAQFSSLVADPRSFSIQLNIAMKTALARGGVSHLSVPKDIWGQMATGPLYPPPPRAPVVMPDKEDLLSVLEWINKAERPVLLVGRGIKQVQHDVCKLAEKIQAPMIVTMPAKSYIPNDHPLFAGGLGQAGSEVSTGLLKQADLCLILGATWWPEEYVPKSVPIVQIDAAEENIGRTHPNVASLVGDFSYLIAEVIFGVESKENPSWMEEIQQKKSFWTQKIREEAEQNTATPEPQQVMRAISKYVRQDAIIALDVGDHTLWFERIFQTTNQEILISGRWRTLGFALPAAMAASLVFPERQVVAIAGDGGIMTTLADLSTAVTYQLPLIIFLINNGSYAMEKNRMKVAGLQPLGSDLPNPDFAALARAFGAEGVRVEQLSELEPAIQTALASNQVCLVDICCNDPVVPHTHIM